VYERLFSEVVECAVVFFVQGLKELVERAIQFTVLCKNAVDSPLDILAP
jgi:hypothetical protein